MTDRMAPAQIATFKRPDGVIIAAMGGLVIVGALSGAAAAVVATRAPDLQTLAAVGFCVVAALMLGAGLLNAWRRPMLVIGADRLIVPTFFGAREIAFMDGHPVGELLASSVHTGNRLGDIESNKFVHFFTLDGKGDLVELVALHRASPLVPQIRRAFSDIAGLTVEVMVRDPKARRPRPDVSHWRKS